ncbi:hypothetical protein [Bdellovibrio bacteriovorus]|uniref:Uncharacterized protein n=1 Tax=Bdellovibrio bacteriovorus TaxID=959 RepID=A0A150WUQ1_BDEBC|nr:hypothetical protein [Bdellovibrio bacteriovorus]KYG70171.1 hypothetical protein AZI85_15360 [Bdellovibrio bacteriovorus]
MNSLLAKADWMERDDIRPYVFVRPENQIAQPGSLHRLDWFTKQPVFKDPLDLSELAFADRIYSIEERAFGPSNMAMPRWVFYDCAVMPGFVAGFACKPSALTKSMREALDPKKFPATNSPIKTSSVLKEVTSLDEMDWIPLSLFIIIPTMHKGEWVAHNLCSINSLLPQGEGLYGLGFLSKAFGLWYANVDQCSGMTQWGSPALKLHSHYGHLEVIGAYAPVHSHAKTITYRAKVNTNNWEKFFNKEEDYAFLENYGPTNSMIDPKSEQSMLEFQHRIESGSGPYFLSASEIAQKKLDEKLMIYSLKQQY